MVPLPNWKLGHFGFLVNKNKRFQRGICFSHQIKHAIGGDNFGWTKWMAISTSRCQDNLLKSTKNLPIIAQGF